jgi:diphthamide synthase (EF-2-diphthine--ammonia ligase)
MNLTVKEKVLLFWSGGRKSAMALHYIKQNPELELVGLVTVISRESNTVPLHGIPDSLLIEQAKMLKLPLQRIFITTQNHYTEYFDRVREVLAMFSKRGIRTIAFGDLDLVDSQSERDDLLKPLEMKAIFPLKNSMENDIYAEFLQLGFKALVTSIEQDKLDKSFLNCEYNNEFVERLKATPANSGLHTFVIYGPEFKSRIAFSKSIAVVEKSFLVSLFKEP